MSSDFIVTEIFVAAILAIFSLSFIGSLVEEYIVNKTINFKSWKHRFYNWIVRLIP